MRVDRDAAAVVGDGDETVGLHLDIDPVGVAGQRLVHGIVDDFGKQVMERLLVGAADIHTWPAPDRLEPFQNLDMFCRIAGLGRRAAGSRGPRPPSTAAARLTRATEQIGGVLVLRIFLLFLPRFTPKSYAGVGTDVALRLPPRNGAELGSDYRLHYAI